MLSQFVKKQDVWRNKNTKIVDEILECVWKGREDSTVNKYCLYLRKFLTFLEENNYASSLPFSADIVAEYLTILKNKNMSKSSITATMASLKWIHSFIPGLNQWNNPMNDEFLSKITSSTRRMPSGVKNQKSPISGAMIIQMLSVSNLECTLELRNCLLAAFAFCLLLRHDELSHVTLDHFEESEKGFKVLIPKSKTDKYRNGSHVYLKKSSHKFSVSVLLSNYLSSLNLKIGENHFLFFPIKSIKGTCIATNQILSYASYRDIVQGLIRKINLDPKLYGTHSLRAGGATELAPNVTELELLTSGRWSDARSIRSYVEMSDDSRFEMNGMLQSAFSDSPM